MENSLTYYILNFVILGLASVLFYGVHRIIRSPELGAAHSSAKNDPFALLVSVAFAAWALQALVLVIFKWKPPSDVIFQLIRTILSTLNNTFFLWAAISLEQTPEWIADKDIDWRRRVLASVAGAIFLLTMGVAVFPPFDSKSWILMLPDVIFSLSVLGLLSWIVLKSLRVRTNAFIWLGALVPILLLLCLQPWEVVKEWQITKVIMNDLFGEDWGNTERVLKLVSKIGFILTLFLLYIGYLKNLVVSLGSERPSLKFLECPDSVSAGRQGRSQGKVRISIPGQKLNAECELNRREFKDLLTFAIASDACDGGWLYNKWFGAGAKTLIRQQLKVDDISWLFDVNRNGSSRVKMEFDIDIPRSVRSHQSRIFEEAEQIVKRDIKERRDREQGQ